MKMESLTVDKAPMNHCLLKKKKKTATVEDIFKCAVVNQYSGALRFLGHGILDSTILTENKLDPQKYEVNDATLQGEHSGFQKSGKVAIPLAKKFARGITQSMQRHATPMSNRTTDVNVHFLFEEMELRGLKRPEGGVFELPTEMAGKNKILCEATFSLIVFRMLNRTHPYRVWARQRDAGKKYRLPKPDDVGEFSTFLQRTACGAKTESMKQWGTKQFEGKIPSASNKRVLPIGRRGVRVGPGLRTSLRQSRAIDTASCSVRVYFGALCQFLCIPREVTRKWSLLVQ